MRAILITAVVLLLMVNPAGAAGEENMLPDPTFAQGEKTWSAYVIEMPSECSFIPAKDDEPAAVRLSGGRTFLHSSMFSVQGGRTYRLSFDARGDGKVWPGFLWWNEDSGMAQPHWTRPEEGQAVDDTWKCYAVEFSAPEGSAEAYVRFEVKERVVTVASVEVSERPTPAPAKVK